MFCYVNFSALASAHSAQIIRCEILVGTTSIEFESRGMPFLVLVYFGKTPLGALFVGAYQRVSNKCPSTTRCDFYSSGLHQRASAECVQADSDTCPLGCCSVDIGDGMAPSGHAYQSLRNAAKFT